MCLASGPVAPAFCEYLPPHLIKRLSRSRIQHLVDTAYETGKAGAAARERRVINSGVLLGRAMLPTPGKGRTVYDMQGGEFPLPGVLARGEGDAAGPDDAVNEAYDFAGRTFDFYHGIFGRRSLDNAGYPLTSSVHYGQMVSNAFWDGSQMIYGDGDGTYFLRFTRSLAIVAHELSHGVVSFTSNLNYHGQSGALNESFCDVMGALVVQWSGGRTVEQANWIMGGEVVGPALGVPGIRSFTGEPAFKDNEFLGDDIQPKHMDGFVTMHDDNGGVHVNSGIPNHAFYLAARAIGGRAWEKTGKIWYDAFVKLGPQSQFIDAATATHIEAMRLYGKDGREASAVRQAWRTVGVEPEIA